MTIDWFKLFLAAAAAFLLVCFYEAYWQMNIQHMIMSVTGAGGALILFFFDDKNPDNFA